MKTNYTALRLALNLVIGCLEDLTEDELDRLATLVDQEMWDREYRNHPDGYED